MVRGDRRKTGEPGLREDSSDIFCVHGKPSAFLESNCDQPWKEDKHPGPWLENSFICLKAQGAELVFSGSVWGWDDSRLSRTMNSVQREEAHLAEKGSNQAPKASPHS